MVRLTLVAPAFASALLLAACAPKDASELGNPITVHGVVTSAATGKVLAGVRVALLSADGFAPVTTDDSGYFIFKRVYQTHEVLVQFQLAGYRTQTITVSVRGLQFDADGGEIDRVLNSIASHTDVDGIDASAALQREVDVSFTVGGWVYAGARAANGATVTLFRTAPSSPPMRDAAPAENAGEYTAKTTTGADGHFRIDEVLPGDYTLRVLPFDADGNGVADYRLYVLPLGRIDATPADLTNLTIPLEQNAPNLLAASFVSLSTRSEFGRASGYPVSRDELAGGLTAVLQTPEAFWMHWGSEVETALARFELAPVDASGRRGAPIGLQARWDSDVIVTLTPASPLTADADATTRYELRIHSLRFKDGTVLFSPDRPDYGSITFDVQTLPGVLANPTPELYLASEYGTTPATQAAVDAAALWLLDANGDFVYGRTAAANWTDATGFKLRWTHVPGAVAYRLYARNTTGDGTVGHDRRHWKPVAGLVTFAVDPMNPQTPVIATGVMRGNFADFGAAGFPWLFGNAVQVAVTSVDVNGFEASIDPSKALTLTDAFAPMIDSGSLDYTAGSGRFTNTTELGATFTKIFALRFSEPLLGLEKSPTLSSSGGNLTLRRTDAASWSETGNFDVPNLGLTLFVPVRLSARGACTEVRLARSAGDRVVPVTDASKFTVGSNQRVAFIGPTGVFGEESLGVAAVQSDATTNLVTLANDLRFSAPQGSLLCAVDGADRDVQPVVDIDATDRTKIRVNQAKSFFVDESVLVYEPAGATTTGAAILRRLNGIDTTTGDLTLDAPLPVNVYSTNARITPWQGSAEYVLRSRRELSVLKDFTLAGAGTPVELAVFNTNGVMAGDQVLIDQDGLLQTTPDQVQATVLDVKQTPAGRSIVVTATRPLSVCLHGRAKVIALGDSFTVAGLRDSSDTGATPRSLDAHADQVTMDSGALFTY